MVRAPERWLNVSSWILGVWGRARVLLADVHHSGATRAHRRASRPRRHRDSAARRASVGRLRRERPPAQLLWVAGAAAATATLIAVSAMGPGCFCAGSSQGFVEVAATTLVVAALVSTYARPPPADARGHRDLCDAGGDSGPWPGVDDVRTLVEPGARPLGDRAAGAIRQSPNLLGFALACGTPALLAVASLHRHGRWVSAAMAAPIAVAPRPHLLASRARGGRRRCHGGFRTCSRAPGEVALVRAGAVTVGLVGAGLVVQPSFEDARRCAGGLRSLLSGGIRPGHQRFGTLARRGQSWPAQAVCRTTGPGFSSIDASQGRRGCRHPPEGPRTRETWRWCASVPAQPRHRWASTTRSRTTAGSCRASI